jgi:hypothetical protein
MPIRDLDLCARCADINLEQAFGEEIRSTWGRCISPLDHITTFPASTKCPLCPLFAIMRPKPEGLTESESISYCLHAYSSVETYAIDWDSYKLASAPDAKDTNFLAVMSACCAMLCATMHLTTPSLYAANAGERQRSPLPHKVPI